MQLHVHFKMNHNLYLRDPESSELGKNIIKYGIELIHDTGFEDFTFKKLAKAIGTTEAGVYRYFENKHRLLTYLTTWYWTWLEYQFVFQTNNITDPGAKIQILLNLLISVGNNSITSEHINERKLHSVVIAEGNKSYFTKHIDEDNKSLLFKPYKDLCQRIADVFLGYSPAFPFPHSLASTVIETAHHQYYFQEHLPRLTDFGQAVGGNDLMKFLEELVYSPLNKYC